VITEAHLIMKPEIAKTRLLQPYPKGFALVVSLSMLALLTVIAVGLLSLSAITMRTTTQSAAQAEAQANARLALMIAIGELQKHLGPDQRISANGDIFSLDEAGASQSVAHPHWTGVWDSWIAGPIPNTVNSEYPSAVSHHQTLGSQPDASMRPDYGNKNRHFRRWLVSLDDATAAGDDKSEAYRPGTAITLALNGARMPAGSDTAVTLVGTGTLGGTAAADHVSARLIPVKDPASGTNRGRYGWWIGDESQKAAIMMDARPTGMGNLSIADRLIRQQAPGSKGNASIAGLNTVLDESLFRKVASHQSLSLLGANTELATRQFHDITTFSFGVLADVREGGLKRDLSTLLERRIDPGEVYQLTNVGTYQRATAFERNGQRFILYHFDDMHSSSINSTGQASVPIQDLAAYYQLYDHYRAGWKGGIQYSSIDSSPSNTLLNTGIMVSNPNFGTTGSDDELFLRAYTAQYRSAVPVKIEMFVSYVAEEIVPRPTASREDPNPETHRLYVGVTPAMTFWNPHNVPIVMNLGNPELYSIFMRHRPVPMQIRIQKSDSPDGAATQTHTIQLNRITNNQQDELFTVFISGNYPAVFQPGETKVFSLQYTSETNPDEGNEELDFYLRGTGYRFAEPFVPTLELIPGWNPERFIRPTTRQATARAGEVFNFRASDYISAEIVAGSSTDLDLHVSQKSRHIRNQARTRWGYRSYNIMSRMNSDATFKNNLAHLGFPPIAANGMPSSAQRSFRVLPRRAQRIINSMGDPGNLRDDLPEHFFYYGVKAATETHDASGMTLASGGTGRRFPARPFLHSSPIAPVLIDSLDGASLYNYGWNWFAEPVDEGLLVNLPISRNNYGYFGGGYTAELGTTHVVQQHLPLTPPISIAGLSDARLGGFSLATEPTNDNGGENQQRVTAVGHAGLAPTALQAVGNSYAHPNIRADRAVATWSRTLMQGTTSSRPLADHSYLANKALWDKFFFSSIFPQSTNVRIFERNLTVRALSERFFLGEDDFRLPNPRLVPYKDNMTEARLNQLLNKYEVFTGGFADKIAAHMMVHGPFNINSTSETAWKALLTSLKGKPVSYLDPGSSLSNRISLSDSTPSGVPANSGVVSNLGTYTGSPSNPNDPRQWLGSRELTDTEIDELAEAIVRHVKIRGPFLSLSEFVNRRLDRQNTDLALKGALQAALDDPRVSINAGFRNATRNFSRAEKSYVNAAFPEALDGPIAYGSTAYVDQADILKHFPAALTPRGDTFVIRAYGDALDASGRVIARAWCEATVQRLPDYVDPVDDSHLTNAALRSATNRSYGRKLEVTRFRWLNPSEI